MSMKENKKLTVDYFKSETKEVKNLLEDLAKLIEKPREAEKNKTINNKSKSPFALQMGYFFIHDNISLLTSITRRVC